MAAEDAAAFVLSVAALAGAARSPFQQLTAI
jgi:hypothetical protein